MLTYVIEGAASHEFGPGPPGRLTAGSAILLTAPKPVSHAINSVPGHTVRWFSAVVMLGPGPAPAPGLFVSQVADGAGPDGSAVRPLVGPGSPLPSAAGLEGAIIEHESEGTSFHRVGHDRLALVYALRGRGRVDDATLDGGEAALVEATAGVALHGQPGFRAVFLSAPRPT